MCVHAWSLPREIDEERWARIHNDAVAVLVAASRVLERQVGASDATLPVLRGPNGMGSLVIDAHQVSFNGNAFRGESGDLILLERKAHTGVIRRADVGDRVFRRCDCRGQPYELAVCAVLLVTARVLGDDLRLASEGSIRSSVWRDAARLVRSTLGLTDEITQDERGFIRWTRGPRASGPVRSSA